MPTSTDRTKDNPNVSTGHPDTAVLRRSHSRAVLGTTALLLGAAILLMALAAEVGDGLPFRMPAGWYLNRPIWNFFAIASIAVGCYLLRRRRTASDDWTPSRPGVRFGRIVLYTRAGCHLCEEARELLESYAAYLPPVEEIDIESDRGLLRSFGTCVPVVEIDGKIRFRGRVNESLLRRLIEGTPPLNAEEGSTSQPQRTDGVRSQ